MTTTDPNDQPFRFSLRTLLVFVLVIGVVLGWFGMQLERARRQREVAAPIRQLGGEVEFTVPWYTWMYSANAGRIRAICFRPEGSIDDPDYKFTDAHLKRFSEEREKSSDVRSVWLECTRVTDVGLEHLTTLANLELLSLQNTDVTDGGLKHLASLTKLRGLDLSETQVTDAGLENLTSLTNLEYLNVFCTQVTYEGAKNLRQALPSCEIYPPPDCRENYH